MRQTLAVVAATFVLCICGDAFERLPFSGEVSQGANFSLASPDRRWTVLGRPSRDGEDVILTAERADRKTSSAISSVYRSALVVWSPDSHYLIVLDLGVHDTRLNAFRVSNAAIERITCADKVLRRAATGGLGPKEIIDYTQVITALDSHGLVTVEIDVSYLPKGRVSGPLEGRTNRYHFDLHTLRVTKLN